LYFHKNRQNLSLWEIYWFRSGIFSHKVFKLHDLSTYIFPFLSAYFKLFLEFFPSFCREDIFLFPFFLFPKSDDSNVSYVFLLVNIAQKRYTSQYLQSFLVSWRKKREYSLLWILSCNKIIHIPRNCVFRGRKNVHLTEGKLCSLNEQYHSFYLFKKYTSELFLFFSSFVYNPVKRKIFTVFQYLVFYLRKILRILTSFPHTSFPEMKIYNLIDYFYRERYSLCICK